jgi:hypothetical protein
VRAVGGVCEHALPLSTTQANLPEVRVPTARAAMRLRAGCPSVAGVAFPKCLLASLKVATCVCEVSGEVEKVLLAGSPPPLMPFNLSVSLS